MPNIKTKAIFYAYSNNALDHLAPYAYLCQQKKMQCIVIYGEDFNRHKVKPKNNIVKIFADQNISTFDIAHFKKKGFLQTVFSNLWIFSKKIEKYYLIPIFFKNKIKGLSNMIFERLDGELIGENIASILLKDTNKVIVFIDLWNTNKKIQNGFLLHMKGKAEIISTNHAPYHFIQEKVIQTSTYYEDTVLLGNHWEADNKSMVKRKEIIGCLRYSKKWSTILDHHSGNKAPDNGHKKNVLVLTHNDKHTKDWKRMLELLGKIVKRDDINLCVLPHVRGMVNIKPPEDLKNVWDNKSSLDVAVNKSDIVIFWVSSAIFEAVIKNKRVLYLSFLSQIDGKFLWQKNAPSNIIIKNEIELFRELDNYDKNDVIDNNCFEKTIWPKGDPWLNVTNFLDKLLNSN
jgi:hypothetical protein